MRTVQYSSKSVRALMRENLRRCWPVSLVFFLILFCSIILPAYMERGRYYFESVLIEPHPIWVIVELVLPIVAASAVYRYLHSSSGTTLMHSLPLSRNTLFAGNFLSGLVLTFAPMVLTMLMILPFCVTGFNTNSYYYSASSGITWLAVWLVWAGVSLLVLFFIYALASLAASLTGNGIGLMAITLVLNFIAFFVYAIIAGYLDEFLIGFSSASSSQTEVITFLNPLFYSFVAFDNYESGRVFFALAVAIFLIIACAAVFAALQPYKRRRLERAGRPICFRFAEIVITYLITLVCMAGMGIAFYYESNSYSVSQNFLYKVPALVGGCAVGAVLTFMIVTMLAQKTPRIFTKKTLKDFGVFAIIAIIFVSFTAFDLTGYTNRVPGQGQIKTAEMTLYSYPFLYPYGNNNRYVLGSIEVFAASEEETSALAAFHRGLVENEKAYRNRDGQALAGTGRNSGGYEHDNNNEWSGRVTFAYDLRGPYSLNRTYSLHSNYSSPELRQALASMPAFRQGATLESLFGYDCVAGISLMEDIGHPAPPVPPSSPDPLSDSSSPDTSSPDSSFLDPSLSAPELARRLDNDFLRLDASELAWNPLASPEVVVTLEIHIRIPRNENEQGYGANYNDYYVEYIVTSSYAETLEWLGLG